MQNSVLDLSTTYRQGCPLGKRRSTQRAPEIAEIVADAALEGAVVGLSVVGVLVGSAVGLFVGIADGDIVLGASVGLNIRQFTVSM